MSGSNPFRLKKSEDLTVHSHPSAAPVRVNSASSVPPIAAGPVNKPSYTSKDVVPQAPLAVHAVETDASTLSDDSSESDPFRQESQDSYVSDEEDEDDDDEEVGVEVEDDVAYRKYYSSNLPPPWPREHDRLPASILAAPPPAPYQSSEQSASNRDSFSQESFRKSQDYLSTLYLNPAALASATRGGRFIDTVNADISQRQPSQSSVTGSDSEAGMLSTSADADLKPLSSRSGNRDKVPPPPPKSHHGKLINSNAATTFPSRPDPSKYAARFSYSGTPFESSASVSSGPPQQDYFTRAPGSKPAPPTEALRRSQSHYKRPPTPPLSRRYSQMRRSKTTISKPTLNRTSTQPVGTKSSVSPSSSRPQSFAHPRTWDAQPGQPSSENVMAKPHDHEASIASSMSAKPTETPSSTLQTGPRATSTKRASQMNPLPPPPPRRRTRPTSLHSKARAEDEGDYVPHPSIANDILADLTRLQKEVDDLRGHYESRKAS